MKKALLAGLLSPCLAIAQNQNINVDDVVVTATRFEDAGYSAKPTNVTVIREEDIKASAATTIPDLLKNYAGISLRDIYGNNGAVATVDLRGFGASGGQNTLVLLDGKRLNDIDFTTPQWSAIPLASIRRIEIVRGSGAVMFGAGATGGIINIITKSPQETGNTAHLSAGYGSEATRDAQAYASMVSGNFGASVTASHHLSDGYRDNNRDEQNNIKADFGWADENSELRLKLGSDQQRMRLPGARTIQPSIGLDEARADWRGTSTPLDWSTRDGRQISLEGSLQGEHWTGKADLAYRDKEQHAYYDQGGFPLYREDFTKVLSFTPRIKFSYGASAEHELITGVDIHHWDYRLHTSDSTSHISQPINQVDVRQNTVAAYVQNYTHLTSATTLSAGFRTERNRMDADDTYDPAAPGAFFGSGATPDNQTRHEHAYEIGLRHAFNDVIAGYGKFGRSYRFANVDEIYENSPTFQHEFQFLKPQTSQDMEIGLDWHAGQARLNASLYRMHVKDEIHLNPYATFGNTNLPPLNRYGAELEGEWRDGTVTLRGSYTLAYAKFTDGTMNGVALDGNDVPLVSRHKLNLSAGWTFMPATSLTASLNAASRQYMDNDEINTLGKYIPGYAVTDLKLAHRAGDWNFSAAVNNLFDRKYYTYAARSQFTADRYALYPLPERNFWLALEYDFK